jgi:type IV pilus assembly protein PilV
MNHRKTHEVRGATMIESMVALMVFSFGILGVMKMNTLASGQNNFGKRQTMATKIAHDLIDTIENLPFDHPMLAIRTGAEWDQQTTYMEQTTTDPNTSPSDGMGLTEVKSLSSSETPPVGAAAQMVWADGMDTVNSRPLYNVAWKVFPEVDRDPQSRSYNMIQAKHILILVSFQVPGLDKPRVVSFRTVKYSTKAVFSDPLAPHREI